MRSLIIGMAVLALVGCKSLPDAAQGVYVAEGSLTAAMQVATTYAQLPACGHGVTVCSDPVTVTRIQAAAQAASTAVLQAQALVAPGSTVSSAAQQAALAQAISAVAALTALTSSVKVS